MSLWLRFESACARPLANLRLSVPQVQQSESLCHLARLAFLRSLVDWRLPKRQVALSVLEFAVESQYENSRYH